MCLICSFRAAKEAKKAKQAAKKPAAPSAKVRSPVVCLLSLGHFIVDVFMNTTDKSIYAVE